MSFKAMKKENKERTHTHPCVLVYGYDAAELKTIKMLVLALDLDDLKVVNPNQMHLKVGDLIAGNKLEVQAQDPILEKVVMFFGCSEHDIHEFIGAYKLTGLKRPIYAAINEQVAEWVFKDWLNDLMQERAEIEKQRQNKKPSL